MEISLFGPFSWIFKYNNIINIPFSDGESFMFFLF